MKTSSIKISAVIFTAVFYSAIVFTSSCKKEGPAGPAGTNGLDGNVVSAADQSAFDAADGLIGGRLYDNFIEELAVTDTALLNHEDFFTCGSCHGFDLRGSAGVLINAVPDSIRPAVAPNDLYVFAQTHNLREVFNAVKHTGGRNRMSNANNRSYNASMPDFSLLLTDNELWKITKFLKTKALNTFRLYDLTTSGFYPTGTAVITNVGLDGNAANGDAVYAANCVTCHGTNGTFIAVDDSSAYVGDFMRNSPDEFQHKVRCGTPASLMHTFPNMTESMVKDLLKAGQNALAYPGF
ncbi:MAG: c-type cytochrome [Bacteroidetes bacterium]|nr:c-type cytochrome [Bacteroidota bacterium]